MMTGLQTHKGPERMVRYCNLTLNYYHKQGLELFDLANDPGELKNVADDPAYAAARSELWTMLSDGWDAETIDRRVRLDQEYRTRVRQSLAC